MSWVDGIGGSRVFEPDDETEGPVVQRLRGEGDEPMAVTQPEIGAPVYPRYYKYSLFGRRMYRGYKRRRYGFRRRPLSYARLQRIMELGAHRKANDRWDRDTKSWLDYARWTTKYGHSYGTADPEQKINRVKFGFRGRGKYNWARAGLRAVSPYLSRAGSAIGGYLGGAQGAAIGRIAGGAASAMIGRGAYQTNALIGDKSGFEPPKFVDLSNENGDIAISHNEYVMDVLGTTAFVNNSFLVNPGNSALFPWLSQIAQNFEEFECQGLVFHFKTTTAELSSGTNQIGTLVMGADYNTDLASATSKMQLLNLAGSVDCKICENASFGVECADLPSNMCVAPNGVMPSGVSETGKYYVCNFQLATNSSANTGQIGELWVSYKFVLRKPKYCVTGGLCLPQATLRLHIPSMVATTNLSSSNVPTIGGQSNSLFAPQLMSSNPSSTLLVGVNAGAFAGVASNTFSGPASGVVTLNRTYGTPYGWSLLNSSTANNSTTQFTLGFMLRFPDTLSSSCFRVGLKFVISTTASATTPTGSYSMSGVSYSTQNMSVTNAVSGTPLSAQATNFVTSGTGSNIVGTFTGVIDSYVLINQSAINAGIAGFAPTQTGTHCFFVMQIALGAGVFAGGCTVEPVCDQVNPASFSA